MSRLQALYLREQGFNNVKVYRPVILVVTSHLVRCDAYRIRHYS